MLLYRGIMFCKLDFTNYVVSCLVLDGLLVFFSITGGIVIVVTVACLLALYYTYIISLRYEDSYAKRQVHLGIHACRRNFTYAMLLIVIIIGGRIIFTDSVASASLEVLDAYGDD